MIKKDRIIPKDLEDIIRNSERPEAPFANKEVNRIVDLKIKEYEKTFNELTHDLSEFQVNNFKEINSIYNTIEWHLKILKKNDYQNQMLQWEHINKFEDNIKSTIELTVFTQNDLTIQNLYNLNLVEWHYFYDDDNMDSDLFSIDITIDNKNIGYKNEGLDRIQDYDNLASMIFKYIYLGGKLEDFKNSPTYL